MIFRTAGQSSYDTRMTKLLVLYYSMYGHIEIMAGASRRVHAPSKAFK